MLYMDLTQEEKIPEAEFLFFPGGEPHVKLQTIESDEVFIRALIPTWEHFGELVVLLNALYHQHKRVTLFLPYFPGARQDRNPNGNTPLTVEIYAKILAPYVHHLIVFDIHSSIAAACLSHHLQKVTFHYPFEIPREYLPEPIKEINGIIVPDKGAVERASLVAAHLYGNCPIIQCEKVRDFGSGNILGFAMDPLPYAGNYLVVDDICDGGWTFNELATAFAKDFHFKDSRLHLYVSHGIFSKGLRNISPIYDSITCTDSFWEGPGANIEGYETTNPFVIPLHFISKMHYKKDA